MSKYFKMSELCKSASHPKLAHLPEKGSKEESNLNALMVQLDAIREKFGKPIYVSSGYRDEALNKAVGGAKNSLHKQAAAADIYSKDGYADNVNLLKAVMDSGVVIDELIAEYAKFSKDGQLISCQWVHYAFLDGKIQKQPMWFDGVKYHPLKVKNNWLFSK